MLVSRESSESIVGSMVSSSSNYDAPARNTNKPTKYRAMTQTPEFSWYTVGEAKRLFMWPPKSGTGVPNDHINKMFAVDGDTDKPLVLGKIVYGDFSQVRKEHLPDTYYYKEMYAANVVVASSVAHVEWTNLILAVEMFGLRILVTKNRRPYLMLMRHPTNKHRAFAFVKNFKNSGYEAIVENDLNQI